MKNKIKKIMSLIMVVCLSVMCIVPTQSVYASTASKAIKAYKKFLKKKSYTVDSKSYDMKRSSFVIKDINNDKVKELIMFPNTDEMCTFVVYSYYKGKVKYVEYGNHSGLGYFNKKSVFVNKMTISSTGIIITYYYSYKKGKLKEIATFTNYKFFDETMKNTYEIGGKSVSKSKFNRTLKSKYKISKPNKYKLISMKNSYAITKSNIKKYVK